MNNIVLSKISLVVVAIVSFIGLYYVVGNLLVILLPFLIGLLISRLLDRPVSFLHRRTRLPRGISTAILLVGFILLAGFGVYTLAIWLAGVLLNLSNQIPDWANSAVSYFQQVNAALANSWIDIPGDLSGYITQGLNSLLGKLGDITQFTASKLIDFVSFVPSVLFFIVIMLFSAFFFTKDRDKINSYLSPIFHGEWTRNEKMLIIRNDVLRVLWGYIRAQLILMTGTFILSAIGLLILGVNYAIPIALGIALVDVLPILGPATVYVPWAISKLIVGQYPAAIGLLVLYLVVTLTRQALEPKIVSTQIGIYPLVTLLSMYLGLKLIGFAGIILGPVTVIVVLSLFKTGVLPPVFQNQKNDVVSESKQ